MNVGILVDDTNIDKWQANAIEYLLENSNAEISLIIENNQGLNFDKYIHSMLDDGVWAFHEGIGLLKRKLGNYPSYREQVELLDVVNSEPVVLQCEPIPTNKIGVRFPESAVNFVSCEADVLIRFGFGFIVGGILTAPEYGVLSYHHGNIREFRGRPAGFWEFMSNQDSVGITVQQLTEDLDAGAIAAEKEVDISKLNTWQDIKHELFMQSYDLLLEAVRNTKSGDLQEVSARGNIYTRPTFKQYVAYIWQNYIHSQV